MRSLLLLAVCIIYSSMPRLVGAARRVDVQGRMTNGISTRRTKGGTPPGPDEVLGLRTGESLAKTDEEWTRKGTRKAKYQETFHDISVFGEGVVVETGENGEFTGEVTGSLVEGIEEDVPSVEPTLSVWDALQIALEQEGEDANDVKFDSQTDAELVVWVDELSPDKVHSYLAYKLSYRVVNERKRSRPVYVINSADGNVLSSWQGLDFYGSKYHGRRDQKRNEEDKSICGLHFVRGVGGNEKIGQYNYGEERPLLPITKYGDKCYLENSHAIVFNANYSYNFDPEVHEFDCDLGNQDFVNGAYSPLNDVFFGANLVTDMYIEWFNITPLNDRVHALVHFGYGMENAFWDGHSVAFGDGNTTFHPLTSLDIVSHEIGHGFTEQHSGLMYSGQSGGINEAFSDISGEAAEAYLSESDWFVGFEVMKEEDGLRYMQDPTLDGRSIGHADDYCPGINVHFSSGVFNRAFYLLANKPGWSVRSAFESFAMANRMYWKPHSTYAHAACYVVKASGDLGYPEADVEDVFREVGVEPCVESDKGMNAMDNLNGRAGEEITFLWDVPDGTDYVKIETFEARWYNQSEISLHVVSDSYTLSSEGNGSREVIEISNVAPEEHRVIIRGETDYSKVILFALSANQTIAHNMTASRGNYTELIIDVSQDMVKAALPIVVRFTQGFGVARYGEPPDLKEYIFDYLSMWLGRDESQILICKPLPGKYYITVVWAEETDVFLYTLNILKQVKEE